MNTILAATLLLTGQVAVDDHPITQWGTDSRVLSCSSESLLSSGKLLLTLGPGHGGELAIRRVSDGTWYFLVVASPPEDVPQLMAPEAFAVASRVEIPATFETRAWVHGGRIEPVMGDSGTYDVYVSENLESEDGGYTCRFEYRPEA